MLTFADEGGGRCEAMLTNSVFSCVKAKSVRETYF